MNISPPKISNKTGKWYFIKYAVSAAYAVSPLGNEQLVSLDLKSIILLDSSGTLGLDLFVNLLRNVVRISTTRI